MPQTDTPAMMFQVARDLRFLEEWNSRNREENAAASRRAECHRKIAAMFCEWADRDPGQGRCIYMMEAKRFEEMATIEESSIARRVGFSARAADIEQRYHALLRDLVAFEEKASAATCIESN